MVTSRAVVGCPACRERGLHHQCHRDENALPHRPPEKLMRVLFARFLRSGIPVSASWTARSHASSCSFRRWDTRDLSDLIADGEDGV